MAAQNNTNINGGIGFVGLLTIVFITLRLLGVITWSWWWVLAPMWISAGLAIVSLVIFLGVIGIVYLAKGGKE